MEESAERCVGIFLSTDISLIAPAGIGINFPKGTSDTLVLDLSVTSAEMDIQPHPSRIEEDTDPERPKHFRVLVPPDFDESFVAMTIGFTHSEIASSHSWMVQLKRLPQSNGPVDEYVIIMVEPDGGSGGR